MKTLIAIVLLMALSINVSAQIEMSGKQKKEKDFTFGTNIYLWAASLDGSTALPLNNPNLPPQTPVAEVNLKFSDAVKYLKMAAMLAGSFKYKSVSLLYDIAYVKLRYDATIPVWHDYINASLTAKTFTGDLDLAYRFPLKNKNVQLDGYGGVRISSLDNTLDLYKPNGEVLSPNETKTWVDPLVGFGAMFNFSKKWFSYLKTDVGGFGVSSKFTWMALGVAGCRFSPNWNTTLGFKALGVNYDKDNFLWDVSQYGLLLSFGYQFK